MDTTAPTPGRFVEPQMVITQFHLREGDVVGDFGAGSGYFTKVLSETVGATGRVYACEIQKNLIETIGALARREGLDNVEVVWGDIETVGGSKLEDGVLDVVIMVNTLFQVQDKPTAIAEMMRVLRSGGKCLVIDWSESFGGLGPAADAILEESTARDLLETAGLTFERTFDTGDHHYGLAMRKP